MRTKKEHIEWLDQWVAIWENAFVDAGVSQKIRAKYLYATDVEKKKHFPTLKRRVKWLQEVMTPVLQHWKVIKTDMPQQAWDNMFRDYPNNTACRRLREARLRIRQIWAIREQ